MFKRFSFRAVGIFGVLGLLTLLNFSTYSGRFFDRFIYEGRPPSRIIEDIEGTAFVYGPNEAKSYRINVGAEPSTSYPSVLQNWAVWPIDGAMALLGRKPSRILIVGIGGGEHVVTLSLMYPDAEIVIVELLDTVIEEMKEYGSPELKATLAKSKVVITDGRRFLSQELHSGKQKYDYMQIGVFRVTTAGAGNLFTHEFLESLKDVLAPGGVLTFNAYLPAVKAALETYPSVVVAARGESKVADVLLSNSPPPTSQAFAAAYCNVLSEIGTNLAQIGYRGKISSIPPASGFFILDQTHMRSVLADVTEQTDDLLATEYFITNRTTRRRDTEDARFWSQGPSAVLASDIVKGGACNPDATSGSFSNAE